MALRLRIMILFYTALLGLLGLVSSARAIDLGVYGPVYDIKEADLIDALKERMRKKIASGEWAKKQQEMRARALGSIREPAPVQGLATATIERSWLWDPSIVLSKTLYDQEGRVIYPAGTRMNPLAAFDFDEPLLFFDARDPKQVAAADRIRSQYHDAFVPILVGGQPAPLKSAWKKDIYFDQGGVLTTKLGIKAVPALVAQDGHALRITEFRP